MYQRCKRCIMDNASDGSIRFDSEGYCNYCNDVLKRLPTEYFPNDGDKRLHEIIKRIKEDCKDNEFDCMVGISGGLDSSYIMYLGHKFGLRMIAVHIDDGLDNPIAVENIEKLIQKTGSKYISIQPDRKEYADVIYALLKASVSNLAIAQDNLILKALQQYGEKNGIKYILDGSNMAHESILERGTGGVDSNDRKFIREVHKRFGRIPLKNLEFMSITERYIGRHTRKGFKHIRPLNYMDYQIDKALIELKEFCDFKYYGGKHYESILTRYMQCYYLPHKFEIDKRKSHFSSLIISGQMTRDEALDKLKQPTYLSNQMYEEDRRFLADYLNISINEFEELVEQPPKKERDYPHSILNEFAPIARKFRKVLE
ncbi:MAG: N-acetyl sugar amidotransferase [Lachnospiraceae bacterium]|nr:N-acetyl sugar amidotransferase [Lachnospiraceae bacterium]